eukprot:CAMPEP_0177744938 /NCGR_PEP_ID=MMETSP0484_2-20121128/30033_1 /TAXON_ID=354590 /ORGANISM="Rhodomonas lens, Strain RHODO" /LENGTH=54 /DNA_ID=CAMNT_0019259515 /DNA_START=79 /DNA_END=243 /DNA_ORIENTATION=+
MTLLGSAMSRKAMLRTGPSPHRCEKNPPLASSAWKTSLYASERQNWTAVTSKLL